MNQNKEKNHRRFRTREDKSILRSFKLNEEHYKLLQIVCKAQGKNVTEFLEQAMKQYIVDHSHVIKAHCCIEEIRSVISLLRENQEPNQELAMINFNYDDFKVIKKAFEILGKSLILDGISISMNTNEKNTAQYVVDAEPITMSSINFLWSLKTKLGD